jgi:putative transcriptional regulator
MDTSVKARRAESPKNGVKVRSQAKALTEMESVAADMKQAFAVDAGKERRLTRFTTYKVTVPPSAEEVKALRTRLKLSQTGLAVTVNVGVRTVQSWEQGLRQPEGTAVTLLWLLSKHSDKVLGWLKERKATDRVFSVGHS